MPLTDLAQDASTSGEIRHDHRLKSPMPGDRSLGVGRRRPVGALLDPDFDQGHLVGRERAAFVVRRHAAIFSQAGHAQPEWALQTIARHNRQALVSPRQGALPLVQTQAALLRFTAVTRVAFGTENRLDIWSTKSTAHSSAGDKAALGSAAVAEPGLARLDQQQGADQNQSMGNWHGIDFHQAPYSPVVSTYCR